VDVLGPEEFDGSRLRRSGTWVVNFAAAWCGFSEEFLPKFASLAGGGGYHLAIGDLTDIDSELWDLFELRVTPTVLVFRDGVPILRRDGRLGEGLDDGDLEAIRAALGPPGGRPHAAHGNRP
jgi:thioredoxin family protein